MVKRQLPNAAEFWSRFPRPAMTRNMKQTRAGIHYVRLEKGKNATGETFYLVQMRSVLGFIDEMSDLFTDRFDNYEDANDLYNSARFEAKKKYAELKEKQEWRIKNDKPV